MGENCQKGLLPPICSNLLLFIHSKEKALSQPYLTQTGFCCWKNKCFALKIWRGVHGTNPSEVKHEFSLSLISLQCLTLLSYIDHDFMNCQSSGSTEILPL